ncbi:GNAT family N-acetyltransferase [Tropicimonas sp. IMCC34043]|uniref:GNAT family N-acetyltransferase n=1 Tax=Tropicimonas sp. IMCC34043 TaxID=2248760 RepID=UPI000E240F1F|nr:GNAT family N-acetyltransferase [Tropicimonas sp. IMCC34043]
MAFRAAVPGDAPAIERFLVARAETSMFLRSNLLRHGPCGGDAPEATRMWLQEGAEGLAGVLGLSTAGFVLVQLPGGADADELRQLLGSAELRGIFGATDQVIAARQALRLVEAEVRFEDDEPLYALSLDRLLIPDGTSRLRQAEDADRAHLADWRVDYLAETLHFTREEAAAQALQDVTGMIERGSLMLLETAAGEPLAMTSFNAIVPDMVQIGNVYTPPSLRGLGHARRAVALHLDLARSRGVTRAILFASGEAASKAYEAIGFVLNGRFSLVFFAQPQSLVEPA